MKIERWLFCIRLMLVDAVVAGGVAGAQDLKPYEGFKGVRWGASVDDMLKVFTNAYKKNRDIGRPRERTYFVGSNIGTTHVDLSLIFLDDKFECAQMSFNPNEFREIVDIFTERYGKPGINEASVVGWSVAGITVTVLRSGAATVGSPPFSLHLSRLPFSHKIAPEFL